MMNSVWVEYVGFLQACCNLYDVEMRWFYFEFLFWNHTNGRVISTEFYTYIIHITLKAHEVHIFITCYSGNCSSLDFSCDMLQQFMGMNPIKVTFCSCFIALRLQL